MPFSGHAELSFGGRRRAGFSLIELVLVISLLGLLAGFAGPLLAELAQSFRYSVWRKDVSENARIVLLRMSRDIRRVQNDTAVLLAQPSAYRFIDRDGVTVEFRLSGNTIEQVRNGVTATLATGVSDLSFLYLDDSGVVLPLVIISPAQTNIKAVQMEMTFTAPGTPSLSVRTGVRLENVMHLTDLFS